jgi:hypothetical protein
MKIMWDGTHGMAMVGGALSMDLPRRMSFKP